MVVPDTNDGHKVVHDTNHQVKNEQEEVSMVLQAKTIVNPRAVVVHKKDASIANGAVMCSDWFDYLAMVALLLPGAF